jgi:hypothetical protein
MTQVDLGLTNVSRFDSADSVVSVSDANEKPGASQPTPPPLRRISSRDSKLQDEVGMWFFVGKVTHGVKLVWLPLKDRLLAVITLSCSDVLILLLWSWAITYEMLGLSTIVAKVGRKFFGNLLRIFLDDTEFLPLSLS